MLCEELDVFRIQIHMRIHIHVYVYIHMYIHTFMCIGAARGAGCVYKDDTRKEESDIYCQTQLWVAGKIFLFFLVFVVCGQLMFAGRIFFRKKESDVYCQTQLWVAGRISFWLHVIFSSGESDVNCATQLLFACKIFFRGKESEYILKPNYGSQVQGGEEL